MEINDQSRKVTRREREFEQRRQEIMSAARTLFIAKGLRNTTLDEIAESSAFGKGTIYNYFANKDDLFLAIVHQLIDETFSATQAAMSAAPEDARAKLYAYALASISHFHANDEVFLMIMREHNQLNPKNITQFVARFQEKLSFIVGPLAADVRSGRIRAADPQVLAALFDGMIRNYWMLKTNNLWPTSGQSPDDVAEFMVKVFFDGIENK
jgi:AcrR family transcriptional regulator